MQSIPKKMIVDEEKKISALQEEFNQVFPYLKIDFSFPPKATGQHKFNTSSQEQNKMLGIYKIIPNDEKIIITPDMTVASLEEQFTRIYGLNTQVLRKSGKIWLETTVTDAWTLEEQNHQGEALSKNIH